MEAVAEDLDQSFLDACADIPETLGDTAIAAAPGTQLQPAAPSYGLTVETLELTFDTIFNMVANAIGDGGEFWQLKPLEKSNLAKAWLPVLGPLLDAWGASGHAPLILAVGMTGMTLAPRLHRDKLRRHAKSMAGGVTERSGDTSSSAAQPEAESPTRETDSLDDLLAL